MYTQCPECQTRFRVTATQLSAANGEVCCGTCETEFNALDSLTDEVPDIKSDNNHRGEVPDIKSDNNHRGEVPDFNSDDHHRGEFIEPEPDDELESPEGPAREPKRLPPWLGAKLEPDLSEEIPAPAPSRESTIAAVVLAIVLVVQLLHYNRDSLAAHPQYGGLVRGFYTSLGLALYPEWRLSSFEVRGTEAVARGGPTPALNILAKVLVVSAQPVGMPLIRIVLRDRWSDPVASGIFRPVEYVRNNANLPNTLQPGTTLPIDISVADPGAEARGYVVDVCLPRRTTGLQCQLAKDPFR